MKHVTQFALALILSAGVALPAMSAINLGATGGTDSAKQTKLTATKTLRVAPAPQPVPVPQPRKIYYNVASPRVALANQPPLMTPTADALEAEFAPVPYCRTIGAACNFARGDGRLLVRKGTHIFVKLAGDIEGVWYEKACGYLGAVIALDIQRPGSNEWVTLGQDSRVGKRCGPAVGTARNIGVVFEANRPGEYLLRARIISFALPLGPTLEEPDNLRDLLPCGDVASDEVFIKVRVIERMVIEDLRWAREKMPPRDTSKVELEEAEIDIGLE
jgi:hypothetical protein